MIAIREVTGWGYQVSCFMSQWIMLFALLLLIDVVFWYYLFARALHERKQQSQQPLATYPAISVIRPIKGCDPGLAENLLSALYSDYPGPMETLLVFDDDRDAGYRVAQKTVADFQPVRSDHTARVLTAGEPPARRTGKLHAMIVAAEQAQHDYLAFSDSDTRPGKNLIRHLVEAFVHGGDAMGCTFAPVVVQGPFKEAGDAGYAVMINGLYGPAAAYHAGPSGKLPFIMGQLMVMHRKALAIIGGLECAEGQFVDDMYLGQQMHAKGLHCVMIQDALPIYVGGVTFKNFLSIYRRWMFFSRNGLMMSFNWPLWWKGISFFFFFFLFITAMGLHAVIVPILAAAGSVLAHGMSMYGLLRLMGTPPIPRQFYWMLWGVLLSSPLVVLSMLIWKKSNWRGRQYDLTHTAKLDAI